MNIVIETVGKGDRYMRIRYQVGSILFCIILFTSPVFGQDLPHIVSPESVGLSSSRLKHIDKLMTRLVDENKIGGSIVLIARKGKPAYFESFGMADVGNPMRKNSLIRIASFTKPVTCVAVMQLYEQGLILLSDPVAKYIPEFARPKVIEMLPDEADPPYRLVPAKRDITIRHLLTNTSGISYRFMANWFPDPKHQQLARLYESAGIFDGVSEIDGTIGEMVRKLGRMPLYNHPGEAFEYGLSTDVLGRVIEIVSGMNLNDYFREYIFKPLKMTDTYFYPPEDKLHRLSALWISDGMGNLRKMTDGPKREGTFIYSASYPYKGSKTYYSGGGGLISTAYDYFRFCQMLLNQGDLDGFRLLGPKTVELMTATNHIDTLDATFIHSKGWKFGLGFAIEMERGYDVDSGSKGIYEWAGIYSTRFSIDPREEKITIMLTQTYPFDYHIDIWDRLTTLSSSAVIDSLVPKRAGPNNWN
ncbi:serine hydrolase domain-containing protein [uncultured Desulfobacter sp.]|uniref:serine hydrolase domain-containing protein n=1 Tax=uncultured Desulfobacter sp. TaxID=240139 RepID=UPI0029F4EBEC|nr:serine hydrolase domain-containing protein [uncultured Desulfobacter sp.]